MRVPFAAVVAAACLIPIAAPAQQSSLQLSGWLQPRYEYSFRDAQENLSSFYVRRARLDVRGQVIWPELTYRIMPDVSRGLVMQDAWVNYAFSPALQVRFGQFTVPFQWHRYVAARRQHFAERGTPSAAFGFPSGRDIGMMLHGRNPQENLAYALGVFDGSGRNTVLSNSDGHLASARLTFAALGPLPNEESDLARRAEPGLSLGLGVQAANRNEVRDWSLGRSPTGDGRADWAAATADLSLRWMGLSLAAEGYLRHVDPDDAAVAAYDGWAYMVSAGAFVLPGRLEAVARFAELRMDAGDPESRQREIGAGLNVYLRAHDVKARVQYLTQDAPGIARFGRDGLLLVEVHVQF